MTDEKTNEIEETIWKQKIISTSIEINIFWKAPKHHSIKSLMIFLGKEGIISEKNWT